MELGEIEVFIRTKDNDAGLNTLLWSLVGQTFRPRFITLLNTGGVIKQSEIYYAFTFFDEVRIFNRKNESYFDDDGEFNASLQLVDCISLFSRKFVWFFDSDLFVPSNCLEELVKKVPSIPKFVVNYTSLSYEDTNFGFYALLAGIEDWSKASKELLKR